MLGDGGGNVNGRRYGVEVYPSVEGEREPHTIGKNGVRRDEAEHHFAENGEGRCWTRARSHIVGCSNFKEMARACFLPFWAR